MPAEAPLLETRELRLAYGDVPVFSGMTLRWNAGDGPLALTGPNGAGKSSFLKACLGLLRPAAGALRVLGYPVSARGFRSALRSVGWIPQQRPASSLRLTVAELVDIGHCAGASASFVSRRADRAGAERAMQLCGVERLSRRAVQDLSGGQFQRACIARALASGPRLLLMDEPTNFLDRDSRSAVIGLMDRFVSEGICAVAIVSHDPELIGLCSRFWRFDGGRVDEIDRTLAAAP